MRAQTGKLLAGAALVSAAFLGANVLAQPDNRNLAIKPQAAPAAERRVALVIGNSAYQKSPLKNPVNDAIDIAQKLRAMGFEVIERQNLKSNQIGRTLREFRARLTPGAVALFFYAGHGLQIRGENYLPAVDADIEGEEDVPNQSIAVRQVMEVMEDAKTRMNLAFLDACRNNPYTRSFRSGGEGLARVSAPSGTLISFATRPGSVAADGTGRNGLYTTHLLSAMETPNMQVELMLKRVVSGVKTASRGMQEPWMEGSIEGDFYFIRNAALTSAGGAGHAQQEAIDSAVHDALRRNNEQAARERAELQASMQKMIEQALARQAALADGKQPAASTGPATTVAMLSPVAGSAPAATRPMSFESGKAPQPGDEWEYNVRDDLFGKHKKMLWRVKAVDKTAGVLEELLVNGKSVQEWAFDGQPYVVGAPIESNFVFGPHWAGDSLAIMRVLGTGDCAVRLRCEVTARIVGKERITLPAGTFDAVRVDGRVGTTGLAVNFYGNVTIWYSEKDRRLLKQVVKFRSTPAGYMADETLELAAARTNQP